VKSFQIINVGQAFSIMGRVLNVPHSEVIHLNKIVPAILEGDICELRFIDVGCDVSVGQIPSENFPNHFTEYF
jgi:hypothetical protein